MTHAISPPRARNGAVRNAGWALALLALPLFAAVAVAMGKEAGWDFQNYHWYDPYALLTGRIGFDVAVGHHATYYNPFIDIPLYVLGSRFPAWVAGAALGVEAGIAAALLGAIAYRLVPLTDPRERLAVSVILALMGMFGGGAFGEIGKTSDDIPAGIGAFAAILVLVAKSGSIVRAKLRDAPWLLLAGFLAGGSPGLKLTALPYVIGLGLAMLTLPGGIGTRLRRTIWFGIGIVIGLAIIGGYWYWTMWEFGRNPVFPYFNDIFHSPQVPPGSYRDETFVPKDWVTRLLFPFIFSFDSFKVAEWKFRDFHIAILYVLIPLAALLSWRKSAPAPRIVDPAVARLLLVTAVGTYAVWIFLFGIYRYLIPLEMLAPLITVAAASLLPLPSRIGLGLAIGILFVAQAVSWKGEEPRFGWSGPYVGVDAPKLPDPDHTMILMTENAPMSYVIPAFPKEIPFLRIQGWMVGAEDRTSGLGREMHERVERHQGPLYLMYWPVEREATLETLKIYGLAIDDAGCQPVNTNIQEPIDQGKPILLCPLERKPS